jgi:outer membrane translocation and assembly module TamA
MRITAGISILFTLSIVASGQSPASPQPAPIGVRTLSIVAGELAQEDRDRVVRSLRGQAYFPNEFEERIRESLRNLGYYSARVEDAELSAVRQGQAGASANVSVKVEPGAQYRFGTVQFHHATIFPPNQLRSQFPVEAGALFNAASVQYGLERIKNLYQDKGYINFGAIPLPQMDEAHHVVDLIIDVDEGKPYVFGRLLLDGVEPHAGAGKALVESWANLQGKSYNPDVLKNWLTANWPAAVNDSQRMAAIENESRQVNFRLQFP